MSCLKIRGGRPLHGTVTVGGRKNSAVAVMPAALLSHGSSIIHNLPQIEDVETHARILAALGARVHRHGANTVEIDASQVTAPKIISAVLAKRMRASYYLLGSLLGRFGEAAVPLPGGCNIGTRPIDQHLKGFQALGAEIQVRDGVVYATAPRPLKGAAIRLDVPSVGATINIMLAAVLADGLTVIDHAAKEPHVVDVARYLCAGGADIMGAGTDTIKIWGVPRLRGCRYAVIPDDIEAATYMIAVAATGGTATIRRVVPQHLQAVSATLRQAGVTVREGTNSIHVAGGSALTAVDVRTQVYPGFPTDAQQPLAALMATATGTSTIKESIWDRRFTHAAALGQMGASMRIDGDRCIIDGVPQLHGATVQATDLRAGAALVVAGLAAQGETFIEDIEHVERGYERMASKLHGLGAQVERLSADVRQQEYVEPDTAAVS